MKLIYKLMRQDPESREGVVTVTSSLGIFANIFIALVKIIMGLAVSSIAIISEGINNATDVASSVLTLVGARLAGRHPTKDHPFGYGRMEYLTGLVVSAIILFTGAELLKSSVELIFAPAEMSVTYLTLIIIAVSALIKLALGIYTIKTGKRIGSGALVALGTDSRNDSVISAVTIVSALIFIIFHFSVDAYAGIITSLFILKAGFGIAKETVGDLLGRSGNLELAEKIYDEIRKTEGVINVADMMLHNYGPDSYSGSANIELDHEQTVGDIYAVLHELQLRIMHEYRVTMVFGIYAVDTDHENVREMRRYIASYVKEHEHVSSFHALYIEPDTDNVYVDLVVDYDLRDWDSLRDDFIAYMVKKYPSNNIVLTVETEYV